MGDNIDDFVEFYAFTIIRTDNYQIVTRQWIPNYAPYSNLLFSEPHLQSVTFPLLLLRQGT